MVQFQTIRLLISSHKPFQYSNICVVIDDAPRSFYRNSNYHLRHLYQYLEGLYAEKTIHDSIDLCGKNWKLDKDKSFFMIVVNASEKNLSRHNILLS